MNLQSNSLSFTETLRYYGLAGKNGGLILNEYGVLIIGITALLGIATAVIAVITIATRKGGKLPASSVFYLLRKLVQLAFMVAAMSFVSLILFQVLYMSTKAAAADVPKVNRPPVLNPHRVETAQSIFKLVWVNHYEPGVLYEVDTSKVQNKEAVGNEEFRSWCKPFNEAEYQVVNRWLVAADEEFKDVPGKGRENWWTGSAYGGLAALKPKWLQIMDDERWYVYEVVKTNP